MLKELLRKEGAGNSSILEFFSHDKYYSLVVLANLGRLLYPNRKLTLDMMEWFQVWYTEHIKDDTLFLYSPYLAMQLKLWVNN